MSRSIAMLVAAAAFPADWTHSDLITIQDNSGSDLTDYQIPVELNASNFDFTKAHSDGADIRFAELDNTVLSYWIESWNSTEESAKLWVKVPSVPASSTATIRMWYGNAGATDASDGDAVFEFFDDFEGTSLDMSKWDIYTEGGASYSLISGELQNEVTGDGDCCYDPEARVKESTKSNFSLVGKRLRTHITYQDIDSVSIGENSYINHLITIFNESDSMTLVYLGYQYWSHNNRDGFTRDEMIEAIFKPNGDLLVYDDGEQITTAPSTYSVEDGKIQLWDEWLTCSGGLGGRTAVNRFGYVFLSEYTAPEPTITIAPDSPPYLTITPQSQSKAQHLTHQASHRSL